MWRRMRQWFLARQAAHALGCLETYYDTIHVFTAADGERVTVVMFAESDEALWHATGAWREKVMTGLDRSWRLWDAKSTRAADAHKGVH